MTLRRARRAGLAVALVLAVAACGAAGPSSSVDPPGTSAATGSPAVPTRPGAPGTGVAIDPGLLDVLPETVDGHTLTASPESDATAAADPAVIANGEAVATAIAVDPASGEFVYVTVVRLRPGVFDEELFRDWRDSFDEGACERAGGVIGTAETTMDERTVHIGSCAEGVRTYHVWLSGERTLLSASSLGERRLGEQLMEDLEP